MKVTLRRAALALAISTVVGLAAASFAASALSRDDGTAVVTSPGVGQTLSFKGTAYKVTRVKLATAIGDSFMRQHTSGMFVVVHLTMTDLKNRPSTILADNVRISTHGSTFSTSDKAFGIYSNGFELLENLQPHLPDSVVAVYEVPKAWVHRAALRVQDIGTGSTATIRLGI